MRRDEEYDIEAFQCVCSHCTGIFDLDEDCIERHYDESAGDEYLKFTCPICGGIKLIDLPELGVEND
jgi:hypothetical protein